MMQRYKSGVSLVELLIALAVFAIISMVIFSIFKTSISIWMTSQGELQARSKLINSSPWLGDNLRTASKIQYVSLADEPNGALQYIDSNSRIVSVFMNSRVNQSRFGTNERPSDNILVMINANSVTSDPVPIFESVVTFSVETFREDPNSFRISTPNNLILPINYGAINSLRISVAVSINQAIKAESQLIRLGTDAIGTSETHRYGNLANPFSTDTDQFTLSGTELLSGGICLATANVAAKIRHSGQYFSTIQAAVDAASAGDIVMIAGGIHTEFITLKNGVQLQGGYDPATWSRNPALFPTTIRPGPGAINNAVIRMASNSQVVGLKVDAINLLNGISAISVTNVLIRQVEVDHAETSIRFSGVTGKIENCAVTGNTTTLLIDTNSSNLSVIRNRFASRGLAKVPNVKFVSVNNLQFRNNLVIKGFTGIYAEATGAVIANNVITGTVNNAFTSQNRTGNNLQIVNNIIVGNAFGIVGSASEMTIIYNYLAQNGLGDGANTLFTGIGNIRDIANTVPIGSSNDPVFSSNSTFVLKSNSVCIDVGNPAVGFNDRYTNGPGLGASRADMGPYGGPSGGRIGTGTVHTITTTESSLQTRILATWPGDWVRFRSGSLVVPAITLRDAVTFVGENTETSILKTGNSGGFTVAPGDSFWDFSVDSSTGTPFSASGVSDWLLDGLVITGSSTGVLAANSASGSVQNCTFFDNKFCLLADNSTLVANANIFVKSGASAVKSDGGTYQGKNNLFFNNITDRSGTIGLSNDLSGDPKFWSTDEHNFFLQTGSPAINAFSTQPLLDLGAYEFYSASGTAQSPVFKSTEARSYKTISVTLNAVGDFGTPPIDSRLTSVEMSYLLDGQSVTLSEAAISTKNESLVYTWKIAPRAIGTNFQATMILKSFKRESTPFISEWGIKW